MVDPMQKKKEKKRKDYAFRRQINEKPSIIPGCLGDPMHHVSLNRSRDGVGFTTCYIPYHQTC